MWDVMFLHDITRSDVDVSTVILWHDACLAWTPLTTRVKASAAARQQSNACSGNASSRSDLLQFVSPENPPAGAAAPSKITQPMKMNLKEALSGFFASEQGKDLMEKASALQVSDKEQAMVR